MGGLLPIYYVSDEGPVATKFGWETFIRPTSPRIPSNSLDNFTNHFPHEAQRTPRQ